MLYILNKIRSSTCYMGNKKKNIQNSGNQKQRNCQGTQNLEHVFVCSCRLQYHSFPALYLHHKTKHGIILRTSFKEQMSTKTVWKGLKKIVIHQFPEESEQEQIQEIPIPMNNSQRMKQKLEKEILKDLKDFISIQSQEDNPNILSNIHESHPGNDVSKENIIVELIKSFMKNYDNVTKTLKINQKITKQSILNLLPYSFNFFMIEWIQVTLIKDVSRSKVEECLLNLSKWLYENKISRHLAQRNQQ